MVRVAPYELSPAEFHRWAEPLKDSLTRALTENLMVLLNTSRIYAYPRDRLFETDYRLVIEVLRFDNEPDGTVILIARWGIFEKGGNVPLAEDKREYEEAPVGKDDYESFVASLSRAIGEMSRDISDDIVSISSHREILP
jgi:uncharacterized lipoprotein YmbA